MDINEIEAGWGEHVFVWVRPAGDSSWRDIHNSSLGHRNDREWQPAKINGFVEAERRDQYKTPALDSRRVWLIDSPYGHDITKFELGELIHVPQALVQLDNDEEPETPPGLGR